MNMQEEEKKDPLAQIHQVIQHKQLGFCYNIYF